MIKVEVKKYTRVETTRTLKLNRGVILEAVRARGIEVPDNARVDFTVPGGGDWSNMSVGICDEHPIEVTWKEVEENG